MMRDKIYQSEHFSCMQLFRIQNRGVNVTRNKLKALQMYAVTETVISMSIHCGSIHQIIYPCIIFMSIV